MPDKWPSIIYPARREMGSSNTGMVSVVLLTFTLLAQMRGAPINLQSAIPLIYVVPMLVRHDAGSVRNNI
jgi:hypothetical protein